MKIHLRRVKGLAGGERDSLRDTGSLFTMEPVRGTMGRCSGSYVRGEVFGVQCAGDSVLLSTVQRDSGTRRMLKR